ncbi:MAG: alpha/beta fold hydrolase [Actinomycetota bacterium]|nr:alpha/beta fold hydrolase [Actinomycetota bacterium]
MAAVTDWTFEGTWPYKPCRFDSPDGRMHYVDEGPRDGRPVVLVHGNPTWGYLYRNFIPQLVEARHRAIAVDHLGFGRSDKPSDAELYRVPRHAERLDALLESLDLRGATVVPQDWAGRSAFTGRRDIRSGSTASSSSTPTPTAGSRNRCRPGRTRSRCRYRCACSAHRGSASCW